MNATTETSSSPAVQQGSASSLPVNDLDVIQGMIDISANRLEGLRTQCATSATLTQQEIRSLETKLVRMFSDLLLTKARLHERIPASGLPNTTGSELKQWLRVVGLSQESLNVCLNRLSTLEQLLDQSDEELKQMLGVNPTYRDEELRRLTKAMENLRKCRAFLANDADTSNTSTTIPDEQNKDQIMENLFWDSWDRHHHHHHHHRGSIGNIGLTSSPRLHRLGGKQMKQQQQQSMAGGSRQLPLNDHSNSKSTSALNTPDELRSMQGYTLTPSPPNSPFTASSTSFFSAIGTSAGGSLNGTPQRFGGRHINSSAGTPPPLKKHQTMLSNSVGQPLTPTHSTTSVQGVEPIMIPLAKSKSNESQFQAEQSGQQSPANSHTIPRSHGQGFTDINLYNYPLNSPESLENNNNANSLQVPRSPCTPIVTRGMGHTISHRFTTVYRMMATCDLCNKIMFRGLKCRECKYRCHKDCEPNVPPSCGLPPQFVDEFIKCMKDQTMRFGSTMVNTSPNLNATGKHRSNITMRHTKGVNNSGGGLSGTNAGGSPHPDSSSPGSSCNSSSPSSPALFHLHQHQHSGCGGGTHLPGGGIMSSSGGGSSSTSSNMLATPSSCHKTSSLSQFNFPDVTITTTSGTQALASGSQTMYCSSQNNATIENETFSKTSNDHHYQDSLISTTSTITIGENPTQSDSTVLSQNSILSNNSTPASVTAAITASMASTGSGAFYVRKLSSAGVDKRGPLSELSDTHKSNDSDKTVSLSGSTSASTDSDRTPVRLDSTEDGDSVHWPRQNSLSLKEWDIPYGDLRLLDQIGKGRFGTVHRALWHGDVAVKLLKEDYLHDEHMLEAFKFEVANFKKTRHENLVLFMGACMNPPHLAIITSLCKGNTLYTYIHARRDKFTINKTTLVAQQISQGMGYLHARGIYHKDLRTKNIFLENGKVIITDFGLFSSTKLLYCDIGLGVPNGWLCYLAPELMRSLLPTKPRKEILPFSKSSDVYSFGTVWYELLCGEFPFKNQPPESIIWQVGRGMKQTLANLQTSRDVKDILMSCWSYQAVDRPEFANLLTQLERLPKKRLARSPSHPVQLSRSAESVF